ncbi:hypothetical protein SAMN05216390_13419 [Lachnospiraceae bacterium KH1T2]|nr:hypothetical protein SAMN05216390_13419 [Lachnospiraceae bacterium KH1T2]
MTGNFVVPEEYRKPESVEIAVKLLEHYLENKDSENRGLITYGDLCKKLSFEMNPRTIERNLGDISFACKENYLPPISALVVNKDEGLPGAGFFAAYFPEKKGVDRIDVWMDIFKKIHAYQDWSKVLEAYRKIDIV